MILDQQLLADLVERVHRRYYGKYRGTVTQVQADTMRVKAKVPAVLGRKESGWAMPCVPYAGPQVGIAFLPEPGAGVWIEFEGGDVSCPIWVGCYWRKGEVPEDAGPGAKAIVTKETSLVLDDENKQLEWTDNNDNTLTLNSDGMALESGTNNVKIGGGVKVNDGALEVS